MTQSASVYDVTGTAVPVRGNDIDTDRIIPARYLRAITFEGLGEHAFEDDRKSTGHPFDEARFSGASLLLANANFGCGSSREHAPQALMRWGINALVGESFAEIFQGNCTAIGVPCATLNAAEMQELMSAVEKEPQLTLTLDLKDKTLQAGRKTYRVSLPEGNRLQLVEGAWDATGMLLEGKQAAAAVAAGLPYLKGFQT